MKNKNSEEENNPGTITTNPGKELILKTLDAGAAITDLMNISISYSIDPSKDRKELEPFKKAITTKFKEYSIRSVRENQVKQSMAKAIDKIKNAALLLIADYPDDDPMWELYFRDAYMTAAEYKALNKKAADRLYSKDPKIKEQGLLYLTSAGFCITDIIYTLEPDLEQTFAIKMMQIMAAVRVQVAATKTNGELKDLYKTLEYIKMLEGRGVYFDENGDPQYTEKYYEVQEKEKNDHEKFFGSTNTSPGDNGTTKPGDSNSASNEGSPGTEGQEGSV